MSHCFQLQSGDSLGQYPITAVMDREPANTRLNGIPSAAIVTRSGVFNVNNDGVMRLCESARGARLFCL